MSVEIVCSCGKALSHEATYWLCDAYCSGCGRHLTAPVASTPDSIEIESLPSCQDLLSFTEVISDNLVVFGDKALFYGSPKRDALPEVTERLIDQHVTNDEIAGSMKPIPYATISKVECNLNDNMVTLHTGPDDSSTSTLINLHDARSRNHFLDLITAKLGTGWTIQVRYYNRLKASVLPLIPLVILGIFLGLVLWASTSRDLDPRNAHVRPGRRKLIAFLLFQVLSLIGWMGLAYILGGFMLLLLVWLMFRVVTPPIEWTLQRAEIAADTFSESDRDLAVDRSKSPVAWISHERTAQGQPTGHVEGPGTDHAKGSSIPLGFITWSVVASVAAVVAFVIGRILILTDLSAWIFNAVFLGIHLLSLTFLFRRLMHLTQDSQTVAADDPAPTDSARSIVWNIVIILILLSALSSLMLVITPSDHIVFSAFATSLSCLGVLLEYWFGRKTWRRHRGFE